ncbi:MAG: response regulator [Chitinivibrionales bacterium]|nr:response regulator [Chitinivibrionales bacterium]MBD3397451.1 response regulator [Chitinivibrionales bacterium]
MHAQKQPANAQIPPASQGKEVFLFGCHTYGRFYQHGDAVKNPRILLVEDNQAELFGYSKYLSKAGYEVTTAETFKDARDALTAKHFEAMLLDLRLPDGDGMDLIREAKTGSPSTAIIVATGVDDISTAVQATKQGADNYLTKPIKMPDLEVTLERCIELEGLRRRDLIQQRLAHREKPFFGSSEAMNKVLEHAEVAASNDTIVLLSGETGTGKGILARWIHEHSGRKDEPFVELNCSSLKGELLRSELFGHAKGAFTSAVKERPGLIEAADRGTLFLDEIGDMDLDVQAQLLTTMEERSYRRVGENRMRSSDFRLLCASNQDLKAATESGSFRKDLYYRICVFPIHIPPLRRRTEDLLGLAKHVLAGFGYAHFPLSDEVRQVLAGYAWPGNVRELRNMLERAILLAKGSPLAPKHFPGLEAEKPGPRFDPPQEALSLEQAEASHILRVLDMCGGDKNLASEKLGISLSSLYRKLGKTERV